MPNPPCRSPPQRVTTEPPCRDLRRPSGGSNRPLPHGLWLVLISTNVRPPYRPFPTATLARTIPPIPGHQRYLPASFPVYPPACPGFPNHNKPTVYRSRPSSLATPPINRIQNPNGHSAFLDDTTTDDLPNQGSPALARRCFRLHRLSHTHLGSLPRRSVPQGVIFFLRYVPSLSSRRLIMFPLPVNTEQFPSNPTAANPHPTPIPPPSFCLNSPEGLPPEPRQPLPVPEGTPVTRLSPPPLP